MNHCCGEGNRSHTNDDKIMFYNGLLLREYGFNQGIRNGELSQGIGTQ